MSKVDDNKKQKESKRGEKISPSFLKTEHI